MAVPLDIVEGGDFNVCVAVLDGVVDEHHPCFEGARLKRLSTLIEEDANVDSAMVGHGTHVASLLFGQPNSVVDGLIPKCRGLIVPVFTDDKPHVSQLDLARAIEQAVEAGAHVINISGGELTDDGEADAWLQNAVRICHERNVLIVAAAGNDGCDCLHVPAAMPSVIAVGAMDDDGMPMGFSNWGRAYSRNGVLAYGENVLGAAPGGGTRHLSGTSFATPIVSAAAALLISEQLRRGMPVDPLAAGRLLLESALPCMDENIKTPGACLVGKLNLPGALTLLENNYMGKPFDTKNSQIINNCACGGTSERISPQAPHLAASSAGAMQQKVYALGTLGYDFGTEARRDTFKQLMPHVDIRGISVPANPYDPRQMVDYLTNNIGESRSLIWTLNIELTPVYAIEPVGSFGREVYEELRQLLSDQIQSEVADDYIERVSIPGLLTGRTVKLFSGQVVPVIEIQSIRGVYGWKINKLIQSAIDEVKKRADNTMDNIEIYETKVRETMNSFLNRVYYDLRNLGTLPNDRALNFAVTNAFQATSAYAKAAASGMQLDSIIVEKSPFCRLDSDSWDVKLKFFDPENNRRAKSIYRFTIDVSDLIPVTLGDVRSWSSSD